MTILLTKNFRRDNIQYRGLQCAWYRLCPGRKLGDMEVHPSRRHLDRYNHRSLGIPRQVRCAKVPQLDADKFF